VTNVLSIYLLKSVKTEKSEFQNPYTISIRHISTRDQGFQRSGQVRRNREEEQSQEIGSKPRKYRRSEAVWGKTAHHQYPRNGFLRNPIKSYTIFLAFVNLLQQNPHLVP
jgi:type V secretory pathway adhesin AidA